MTFISRLWARALQIGFTLLYNQLAPTYDLVSWLASFGQWREWQLAALPFIKGPDVLEIAFGTGHILLALSDKGYNTTGVDLSNAMCRLAHRRLQEGGASAGLVRAPAQVLPFGPDAFDSILATFPTQFILDPDALNEINRVLREDGRLLIVPEARLTGQTLPVRLLEAAYWITGQRETLSSRDNNDPPSGLLGALSSAGFTVTTFRTAHSNSEVTVLLASKHGGSTVY